MYFLTIQKKILISSLTIFKAYLFDYFINEIEYRRIKKCVCVRVAERNMTELFKTKKKEKSFVHLVLKRYKKKGGRGNE